MTLRILILGSRGVPARYGGFETFAEFLGAGLADLGHEMTVYCPDYQEYREASYRGIRLRRIQNRELGYRNRVLRALCNLAYDIRSLVDASRSDADIVYMLGYAAGPFLIIPRMRGRKLVLNPDGLEWKSARWGLLARSWLYICEYLAAKIPDLLIADAEPIALRFSGRYGCRPLCIPYGTDIVVRAAMQQQAGYEEGSYYLSVARMVPETKVHEMIDGFRRSGSGRRYLIVGPVADRHYFESEVAPRLGGAVEYLGAIYDRARLNSLRGLACALLHGHASDGTNPSLLESMGCGSPVIAIRRDSNVGVLSEENALFFEDADELALRMREFERLSDAQRADMGARNAARVAREYSWDASVRRHAQAFEQLLGETQAPA